VRKLFCIFVEGWTRSDMCFISLNLFYICVCSCGAGSPDSHAPTALQSAYACERLQQRLPTFTARSQFHREPFIVSGKYRLVFHHHHRHHHHHHPLFLLSWIKGTAYFSHAIVVCCSNLNENGTVTGFYHHQVLMQLVYTFLCHCLVSYLALEMLLVFVIIFFFI